MTPASGKAEGGAEKLLRAALEQMQPCKMNHVSTASLCSCPICGLRLRITGHLATAAANGPGEAPSDEVLNAGLVAAGMWIEPRVPASENGIPIECGVTQAEADEFNVEGRGLMLAVYHAMQPSTPQSGMVTVPRETLERLRLTHHCCEDSWYSCPKHEDGCSDDQQDTCNCGADSHNAIIDTALRSGGRETEVKS